MTNPNDGGPAMTNAETATHLRKWVEGIHFPFAWPTDACGYEQHIKFVRHRNKNWSRVASVVNRAALEQEDWKAFILAYAEKLDAS